VANQENIAIAFFNPNFKGKHPIRKGCAGNRKFGSMLIFFNNFDLAIT
jgi:hypothetical protein